MTTITNTTDAEIEIDHIAEARERVDALTDLQDAVRALGTGDGDTERVATCLHRLSLVDAAASELIIALVESMKPGATVLDRHDGYLDYLLAHLELDDVPDEDLLIVESLAADEGTGWLYSHVDGRHVLLVGPEYRCTVGSMALTLYALSEVMRSRFDGETTDEVHHVREAAAALAGGDYERIGWAAHALRTKVSVVASERPTLDAGIAALESRARALCP